MLETAGWIISVVFTTATIARYGVVVSVLVIHNSVITELEGEKA